MARIFVLSVLFNFRTLLILILLCHKAVCLVTLNQAFALQPAGDAGSCANSLPALNGFWNEINMMTGAAITHLNAALGNIPNVPNQQQQAERAASMWLASTTNQQRATALQQFQWLQDFLNQGLVAPRPPLVSHLFCDDTWLQQRAWTDPVVSALGNLILVPDGNGGQRFKMISEQYPADYLNLFVTQPVDDQLVPFYGAAINAYQFESPGGICANNNLGATSFDAGFTITVTLCPTSFNTRIPAAPAASLGQAGAQSASVTAFQALAPPSLTFFHELFHLVFPQGQSPDVQIFGLDNSGNLVAENAVGSTSTMEIALMVTQPQLFPNQLGLPSVAEILKNPESYVWFGLQAWYFYNANQFFSLTPLQLIPRILG